MLWEPNVLFLYSKLLTRVVTGRSFLHICNFKFLLIMPMKQEKLKTTFTEKMTKALFHQRQHKGKHFIIIEQINSFLSE